MSIVYGFSTNVPGIQGYSFDDADLYVSAGYFLTEGDRNAIYAESTSDGSNPTVYGWNASTGTGSGVYAVYGRAEGGNLSVGVNGISYGLGGNGVIGQADGTYGVGVYGRSAGTDGYGVSGWADANNSGAVGVFGYASYANAYAGYFVGKGYFSGALTKAGGGFVIDHPLDPANKTLTHSFVESPDMKNVYDGLATANFAGEILIEMPLYFEALNSDFRYQLTALGTPAPNLHVKEKLSNGRFTVAGAAPGQEVSWQVTGIRQDAWAQANRLGVEADKPAADRGLYLSPEVFGQPTEKGIDAKRVRIGARALPPVQAPSRPPPPVP